MRRAGKKTRTMAAVGRGAAVHVYPYFATASLVSLIATGAVMLWYAIRLGS
jgi:hypothetical protein